jgi:hypothetical protein
MSFKEYLNEAPEPASMLKSDLDFALNQLEKAEKVINRDGSLSKNAINHLEKKSRKVLMILLILS